MFTSPPSTPRPLKSPRAALKEPRRVSAYFDKIFCNPEPASLDRQIKRIGRRIINAFNTGQPTCFIKVIYLNRDYKEDIRFVSLNDEDTVCIGPIVDQYTLKPFKNGCGDPFVYNACDSLVPIINWIHSQGLKCQFLSTEIGRTQMDQPVLADWTKMAVHVDNKHIAPNDRGHLSSLWNGVITAKCVDDSHINVWRKRVIQSIECGHPNPVVLMRLFPRSDYHLREHKGSMKCKQPIQWRHCRPVHQILFLDKKFVYVVNWCIANGLQWTLGLEQDEKDDKSSLSDWAYFMVYMVPPSTNNNGAV